MRVLERQLHAMSQQERSSCSQRTRAGGHEHFLPRNSKDEKTVTTACLKLGSDKGLKRPLGLLGRIRSGTHPGQEHATPSKAGYSAADLSLDQTCPCSHAADYT